MSAQPEVTALSDTDSPRRMRPVSLVRLLVSLLLFLLMVRIAWMGDDALITLRAILNLTHGWGPGFNAFEAVQSSTHPLWFLLWMGVGSLTGDWFVPILLLSAALASGAVYLILQRVRSVVAVIAMATALALSNAFMEYSSSGLENSLAYMFVALLIVMTTRSLPFTTATACLVGITAAGLILTRFDLALVIAPIALVLIWQERRRRNHLFAAAASFTLPLIAWFTWSWVTYATFVPNTLAAKQNTAIPRVELLVQGGRYLWVSFERDPVSLLILMAGIAAAIVGRSLVLRAWTAGVVLYLAYVIWIGGDFMAGRFIAVPVLVTAAVAGIVAGARITDSPIRDSSIAGIAAAALIWLTLAMGVPPTSIAPPTSPRWEFGSTAGVSDEYGYHLQFSRDLKQIVMALGKPLTVPPFQGADALDPAVTLSDLRSAAAAWPTKSAGDSALPSAVVPQYGFLGTIGVLTGPTVHLVDRYALTDRFLSSQTYIAPPFQWRAGHLDRAIPDGYLEAIATNDPSNIEDPYLQAQLRSLWKSIRP